MYYIIKGKVICSPYLLLLYCVSDLQIVHLAYHADDWYSASVRYTAFRFAAFRASPSVRHNDAVAAEEQAYILFHVLRVRRRVGQRFSHWVDCLVAENCQFVLDPCEELVSLVEVVACNR